MGFKQHNEYRNILLIRDDTEKLLFMEGLLSQQFCTIVATDEKEGYRLARSRNPDLVLLDLLLPKLDGVELCSLLRNDEATRHIPIIGIAADGDFELELRAHSMGADDVIKKLVRPRELLARISNKIRRVDESKTKATHLSVGDVDLNLERFECRIQSKLVTFSVLEFNLFRYFVENVNRVLSRELILKSVWGETAIADRKVDTHMTSLRKKIRNSSLEFSTLYGAGYILKSKEREPSVSP